MYKILAFRRITTYKASNVDYEYFNRRGLEEAANVVPVMMGLKNLVWSVGALPWAVIFGIYD